MYFEGPRFRFVVQATLKDINSLVPGLAWVPIYKLVVPSTTTRPRQTMPHSTSPVPRTTATHSLTYSSGVLELPPGTGEPRAIAGHEITGAIVLPTKLFRVRW